MPFEIEPMAIDDLAKGNGAALDAVLLGLLAAQDAIGIGKAVEIAGPPLFSQPFVIAAEPGDPDFEAGIAAAVEIPARRRHADPAVDGSPGHRCVTASALGSPKAAHVVAGQAMSPDRQSQSRRHGLSQGP